MIYIAAIAVIVAGIAAAVFLVTQFIKDCKDRPILEDDSCEDLYFLKFGDD